MTYKEAKKIILDHLEKNGWKISDRRLKIPHATSPTKETRYWVKPQSLYKSELNFGSKLSHNLKNARSTHRDIRKIAQNIKEKGL